MTGTNPSGRETELKLLLPDAAAIDRLLAQLGPELPAVHQRNVYYDGPAGEWSSAGLAVRMRREGSVHQLTVKTMGESQNEFMVRGEYERQIEAEVAWRFAPGGTILLAAVADLLAAHGVSLPDHLYAVPLREVGSMDNLRRRAPLLPRPSEDREDVRDVHDVDTLIVELDTTTYPDGQVVCEAELEVPDASAAQAAVRALRACFERAHVQWQPSMVSKRERLERVLRGRVV